MNKEVTTDLVSVNKKFRKSIFLVFVVLFVIGTVYALNGNSGSVIYQIDNGVLGVGGNAEGTFVNLDDITEVSLIDSIDVNEQLSGESTEDVYSGTFLEKNYGECEIMSFVNSESYILINHNDKILIVSMESEGATNSAYEDIIKALEK